MILSIVTFIIVLGIIVFVHEIGHFYTAKKLGIGVEEFGFGYPPKIFGIKKGGVLYSLNLIPLGGFVKIKGETGEDVEDEDSFQKQAIWKRAVVLLAGVFNNWVFAFILISIGYFIGFPAIVGEDISGAIIKNQQVQIMYVHPDSSAKMVGFEMGDYIKSADDNKIINSLELDKYIKNNLDKEIEFLVNREKEDFKISAQAKVIPELSDKKVIGFDLADSAIVSYVWYKAPVQGFKTTVSITRLIIGAFGDLLKNIFTGKGAGEISGPVGVAVFTGKAVDKGFVYLLQFMALLSINLAIINAFPFPALDGGRVLFLIIEKIRRKKNNEKIEAMVHNVGFMILMLLILLVTYKDIVNLFNK